MRLRLTERGVEALSGFIGYGLMAILLAVLGAYTFVWTVAIGAPVIWFWIFFLYPVITGRAFGDCHPVDRLTRWSIRYGERLRNRPPY